MDSLKDFRELDLVEQITRLNELEAQKPPDAIPALLDLVKTPTGEETVDFMVEQTLRTLLLANESQVLEGLASPDEAVFRISMEVAGETGLQAAAPILKERIARETDPEMLFRLLDSYGAMDDPAKGEIFRPYVSHPDTVIAGLAMEVLGKSGDEGAAEVLCPIVTAAEVQNLEQECPFHVYKAVEALARIGSEKTLQFLTSRLHHPHPTVRRLVQQELTAKGGEVVPFMAPIFATGDEDEKIMAANLLGAIGERKGADILVEAIHNGQAAEPNVRYAVLEALGNIPSIKGVVCLLDELETDDPMLLMAVTHALDAHVNPTITARYQEAIRQGTPQSQKLLQAVIETRSFALFEALFQDDQIARELVKALPKTNDPDLIADFCALLGKMSHPQAQSWSCKLASLTNRQAGRKILVVDDSKAMLSFYRAALSQMGYQAAMATNGKEGLECLEQESGISLIITDLNMPVMDGIEFTRTVRENPAWQKLPILMATTEKETSQKETAARAGVNDFISKPFTADVLREKLRITD